MTKFHLESDLMVLGMLGRLGEGLIFVFLSIKDLLGIQSNDKVTEDQWQNTQHYTDIATYRLNWPRGRCNKICKTTCQWNWLKPLIRSVIYSLSMNIKRIMNSG